MSLVVRGETLNWARKRASGQAGQWEGELVPDKGELSASRKRWSRLGSRHSDRTAIKLRNMRTASDIIIDKLDDLTSSVDFIKSKNDERRVRPDVQGYEAGSGEVEKGGLQGDLCEHQ